MNDGDWQQVDQLFQSAVELGVDQRGTFLNTACGEDGDLRREVESLLSADSEKWDLIDIPAIEAAAPLLAHEPARLTAGQEVGHYEILSLIGKGGMGEVYLARDRILNRNIALKLLPFYYTENDDRLRRFQREAHSASALNHPNIITIYELGSVDNQQFIAAEFIEGETLRERLSRGAIEPTDAIEITIQTAAALAAAHRAGIVHRDIKPENIMLRPDGYVKVLDFGLAKLTEDPDVDNLPMPGSEGPDISSGMLMGTLRYMSPEQASGSAVDARSDIFSLGVVLYEMVAGRPPFEDDDAAALVGSILNAETPPLPDQKNRVSPRLAVVIDKALAKNPDLRYQDADSLLTELDQLRRELHSASGLATAHVDAPGDKSSLRKFAKPGTAAALVAVLAICILGYGAYRSLELLARGRADVDPVSNGTWTAKATLSAARYQVEPAVLNGRLYFVGGWNVCTPFADLESYDPSGEGLSRKHAPMPTARGAHGVGVLNGLLYAVGGTVDCGVYTTSVEAYDPGMDKWFKRSPLPTERTGHGVAAINGKLYAIGGQTPTDPATSLNTEYDPITDRWVERAAMPTARSGSAVAVVNEIVYVIGGSFSNRPLSTVEAYDPRTNSWTTRTPMQTPRTFHAAAAVDGLIYAFGGSDSNAVEAYNPNNDTWEVVGTIPSRLAQIHAETVGRSIYFAGGSDGVNYLSTVMAFTPDAISKPVAEKCPAVKESIGAPMPTARTGMAVGEIGGKIYVVGGYDRDAGYLSTNEVYDPVADKWTTKSSMPTAREVQGTSTAVIGGRMFVVGGNASGYCTGANEAYDPSTDSWTARAPMPTPRCHLALVSLDGIVYAFGGTNTNGSVRYSALEIYDPATDTWTTGASMPTGRHYMGAVGLNGLVYAVGGWNPELTPDGALDVVEAYDPIAGRWLTLASMETPRMSPSASAIGSSIVVVGGGNKEALTGRVEIYSPNDNSWSTLAIALSPRIAHSSTTVNDRLYSFGGRSALYMNEAVRTTRILTFSTCPVE